MLGVPRLPGSALHLQPTRKVYNMAAIAFRLSIRGRPPLGLGSSGGSNGPICYQSESEIRYDSFTSLFAIVWTIYKASLMPKCAKNTLMLVNTGKEGISRCLCKGRSKCEKSTQLYMYETGDFTGLDLM